ncbi:uncharacterized protein aus isoform X2 [Eurosta solidaginis]|uniref:uncharacterized protein aus isoform X2 n=1 Tax=Eurosta solidaginis TaxID=178769 RepID=UPI003530FC97
MQAAITHYTTPCVNSYQNVPHVECTTTTINPTTATTTKLRCIDAVAVENDQDEDDGCIPSDSKRQRQKQQQQRWRHRHETNKNYCQSETRVAIRGDSMGANLRSNRCQREHKNYRKHVMMSQLLSCKRRDDDDDEIHAALMTAMLATRNKTQNSSDGCRLNLATAAQQSSETILKRRLKRSYEDVAGTSAANVTEIADIIKSTLELVTGSTPQENRSPAAVVLGYTSTPTLLSSYETVASVSPWSRSKNVAYATAATTSTLKTQQARTCLKDNNYNNHDISISKNKKRQLVMPIEKKVKEEKEDEEDNRIENLVVVAAVPQLNPNVGRTALMTTLIQQQQHSNIQLNNNDVPTHKAPATTSTTTQWRHRILPRPTLMLSHRVGNKWKESFELLASVFTTARRNCLTTRFAHNINVTTTSLNSCAPTVVRGALKENSHTTIKLDCRCFKKDKSDICMAANKKGKVELEENEALKGGEEEHSGLCSATEDVCNVLGCSEALRQDSKIQQQRFQLLQRYNNNFLSTLPSLLRKHVSSFGVIGVVPHWSAHLMILMLIMLTIAAPANCWTGRSDVPTNCTFPARWEGSWFLSGYQQSIHIKGSQFSYRGKCAASDGNKYLIVDEKGCHRCLVIYEKHKNVLQYKESECEGDSMYMHQTNPSALAMRSVLKQSEHRGGAHPNLNNNNNGHSRLSSSDQYIMRSYDDMNDYFCKGRETLQNLCDQIPGDALLYSLFRESAEPVKCPLKGPFIFTYNRGHGECRSPVSNIESCTEDSRLLLSFQACPDVQGTESTVEELTCLATWKDGNSRYLVGLVSHHHAISNEERYRCFVYEKISSLMGGPSIVSAKDAEYKLAQSGDATCNGLDSAEVGSRIMSLRKPPVTERCDFPVWFKGPRHWHVLMGNAVYNYHPNDGSVHIIKPNGFMETRALCEQINKQTSTEMMAVVHYTTGCQSGFMCMMFYRRDTHVIEIQTGKQASRLEDACAPDHFDVNRMPYITLLASNPDPQMCPMEGLYNLRGAIGPPYLTTRHKRNHNNKIHATHGHHHASQSDVGIASTVSGSESSGHARKRHVTLSLRNSETTDKTSLHADTRGLAERNRRAASSAINNNTNNTNNYGTESTATLEHMNILKSTPQRQNYSKSRNEETAKKSVALTSVDFVHSSTELDNDALRQRNRRDAPGCITNYKAQRRLWVGCTEPDVIDVRPLCNEDGDEEYSCHGSWTENSTVYIIARHKGTKHGVCLSYRPTEGTAAKLVIGDACYRGTQNPPDHHLVANLTIFGKCGDTGSAAFHIRPNTELIKLAVLLFALNNIKIMQNQR